MGQVVLKISVQEFYDLFISNDAKFPLEKFFEYRGNKNIKLI